jgi:hypothetical protein
MVSELSTSRVMVFPVTVEAGLVNRSVRNRIRGSKHTSLDEDLHSSTKTEDQVKGGLLLDVVVGKSATILKLLTSEDETLLVRRDTLLVLDLRLYVVDGVGALNLQGNGLSGKSLDEDLHTSTKTKDQVESRFLLDVVIGESTTVFELLSGEDQALLVRRNTLLVLDLGLDIIDGVG